MLSKNRPYSSYFSLIFICFFLFSFEKTSAQSEDELGAWYMYFGANRVSDRWSIHSEAQFRLFHPGADMEQMLLRTGANYHINDYSIATLGYAYIATWRDDEAGRAFLRENRIFQQFILRNSIGRVYFEHRYRQEQRWVSNLDTDNSIYENRARYRLYMAIPINHSEIKKGTFYFAWYDEIFVNITNDPFGQNRFYTALGYQLNKNTSMQAGFLLQSVGSNPVRNFKRLQLALIFNPDLRK